MKTKTACTIARSFPGVSEKDHFGSDAFIANKRIFATVWHDKNEVNVRLNKKQQRRYLEKDGGEAFREIPTAWGTGMITIQLEMIDRDLFTEALKEAWETSSLKFSSSGTGSSRRRTSKAPRPRR